MGVIHEAVLAYGASCEYNENNYSKYESLGLNVGLFGDLYCENSTTMIVGLILQEFYGH